MANGKIKNNQTNKQGDTHKKPLPKSNIAERRKEIFDLNPINKKSKD